MRKAILLIFFSTILISGCVTDSQSTSRERAEKTAVDFSVLMSGQNYDDVYKLLLPDIQTLYTPNNFSEIMYDKYKDIVLIYDKTVLTNNSEAYAYYKMKSGIVETSMEPLNLKFYNGEWRINAFAWVNLAIEQKRMDEQEKMKYELQKKEYEENLSKLKYFFKIGEEANNSKDSVKINFAYLANSIAEKYGEDIKPSKTNNTFLIIVVEAKIELGLPDFGNCVYPYNENRITGNKYFPSDNEIYCHKPTLLFVEDSLEEKLLYSTGEEKVTGIIAYEVPANITEFVIPYEDFYYDVYNKKSMRIYFIAKT